MTVASVGLVPKKSLGQVALELEVLCREIDSLDGEITEEMMTRFDDAHLALADKTDNWILYLDGLKAMAGAIKERKERAAKAQKAIEALQTRLKEYLKFVIETNPGLQFKGSEGSLYLHNNPESVKYTFGFEDKTFYRCIQAAVLDMEPSVVAYVKAATVWLVDGEKVKNDLKAGMRLPFASLERGSHVRMKG